MRVPRVLQGRLPPVLLAGQHA